MNRTNVIIDGNNILYRTFHANNKSGEPDNVVVEMCIHSALSKMNEYYNMFKADDIIITFDSYSWRKEYTKDLSKCVTNKKYKDHRRKDHTPKQQELHKILDEHIEAFYNLLKNNTSVLVLRRELLEGDDLMAAFVQMHRDDYNILITGDKDMIQLLRYENVKIVNPADNKERSLSEWNDDPDLFLFEKCIRGEAKKNDNIQSSYPYLKTKKLFKAYDDLYEYENVMNHTFKQVEKLPDGEYGEVTYTTKDLYKENKTLMDLTAQPKIIKKEMVKTINEAKENRGTYDHMKFLRFCHNNELNTILSRVSEFVPMLNNS